MAVSDKNSDSWRLLELPFWPDRPDLWFEIIELQFTAKNLTDDEDKFNYVIVMLGDESVHLVEDILFNRPEEDLYTHLKRELLKRVTKCPAYYSITEKMAGRNPSKFYNYLLKVSGSKANEQLVVMIWKSLLPECIRSVLETIKSDSCTSELLQVADAIYIKETEGINTKEIKRLSEEADKIHTLSEKYKEYKYILKCDQFIEQTDIADTYSRSIN